MALTMIRTWVEGAGLILHPDKTHIVDSREKSFRFLVIPSVASTSFLAKSHEKFVARIRELTPRKSGQSLASTITAINQVTRGWFGYFRHCYWPVFKHYDGMIRRRLRRQLLKRHRRNPKRQSRTRRWPNSFFTSEASGAARGPFPFRPIRYRLTGEPYAGKLPVRFGGRGEPGNRPSLPLSTAFPASCISVRKGTTQNPIIRGVVRMFALTQSFKTTKKQVSSFAPRKDAAFAERKATTRQLLMRRSLALGILAACCTAACWLPRLPPGRNRHRFRRELFVDDLLIDRLAGARLVLHPPQPREIVLKFDQPWEGLYSGYETVLKDGDVFRFYYRGMPVAQAYAGRGSHLRRGEPRRHPLDPSEARLVRGARHEGQQRRVGPSSRLPQLRAVRRCEPGGPGRAALQGPRRNRGPD